jgi:hypothetical protein
MLSKVKAASQAPKKTLKLTTLVSSLLQVYPSPIFQLRNPGSTHSSGFARYFERLEQL